MASPSHDCLLTEQVMAKLKVLKANYVATEQLMFDTENVAQVRARLREINSEFDILMCLCTFVDEDETMPGCTSHKVDFVKGKEDFMHRVEAWLACVELPGENGLCEPESASGSVHVARCGSDAGVGVCGRPSDMATGSRSGVRSQGVHVVRCGSDVGVGVCDRPSDVATGSRAGVRSQGVHVVRCGSDVGVGVCGRPSDMATGSRAGVRSQGVHVVRCGSDVGVGVCGRPSDVATGSRAGVRSQGVHVVRCGSDVGVGV